MGRERLVADPSDVEAKVDFVTLYHMIIEGTLALTGQWFLTDFMERKGILPGWVEGFRLISQDEHRHVAYGTWFLREKARDPGLRGAHRGAPGGADPARLRRAGAARAPTAARSRSSTTTAEEINTFAFNALSRRLKVIGIDLADIAAAA